MGYPNDDGCCCCLVCFAVTCSGTAVEGVTVTVQTGGGTTVGSATTDSSGNACVGVPSAATYNWSAAKTGYTTKTGTVTATCPGRNDVAVNLCCGTVCLTVTGCAGAAVAGAAVTVTATGFSASCTTDGTGKCCVGIPSAATYSYSVSKTGYATASGSVTATCTVNNKSVSLSPATGWSCTGCPSCCDCTGKTPPYHPPPPTLNASFRGGTGTLTGGAGTWSGEVVFSTAHDCGPDGNPPCGCNGAATTGLASIALTLTCSGTTWTLAWEFDGAGTHHAFFGGCWTGCADPITSACAVSPCYGFACVGCNEIGTPGFGNGTVTGSNSADCSQGLVSLSFSVTSPGSCTVPDGGGGNPGVSLPSMSGTVTVTN